MIGFGPSLILCGINTIIMMPILEKKPLRCGPPCDPPDLYEGIVWGGPLFIAGVVHLVGRLILRCGLHNYLKTHIPTSTMRKWLVCDIHLGLKYYFPMIMWLDSNKYFENRLNPEDYMDYKEEKIWQCKKIEYEEFFKINQDKYNEARRERLALQGKSED